MPNLLRFNLDSRRTAAKTHSAIKLLPLMLAATLLTSFGPAAHAQAAAYPGVPPLLLGAAWYPEQWPEAQWDADLAKMEAANIHLVRVGEFAWSTMEPEEGKYDFTWLD